MIGFSRIRARTAIVSAVVLLVGPLSAHAASFSGTLFYTTFAGGQNVNKVDYLYDDVLNTFGLSSPTNVASTNGADGIIFAPNGNLLIGGQGSQNVYEINPNNGALVHTQATGASSFHLGINPNGNTVYSSTFGGTSLKSLSLPIGSGVASTAISGDDPGVTEIEFVPNGTVFYVNGQPNGNGNVGTINLNTGVTTRLFTGVGPAHGLAFDPFTNLLTMFGAGRTGTINQLGGDLKISANPFINDFDQGAVDGLGHALVAGSNSITFIDYRTSGDITNPDFFTSVSGFSFIDDVAPLVGAGSRPVPTPGVLALFGAGLVALGLRRSGRRMG